MTYFWLHRLRILNVKLNRFSIKNCIPLGNEDFRSFLDLQAYTHQPSPEESPVATLVFVCFKQQHIHKNILQAAFYLYFYNCVIDDGKGLRISSLFFIKHQAFSLLPNENAWQEYMVYWMTHLQHEERTYLAVIGIFTPESQIHLARPSITISTFVHSAEIDLPIAPSLGQ